MYGGTNNTARHHGFRFAESEICDFASVSFIQLKCLKTSNIIQHLNMKIGRRENVTQNEIRRFKIINIFILLLNANLTYQDIFQFDITVNKTLTMQKSDSFNHIYSNLEPAQSGIQLNVNCIHSSTAQYMTVCTKLVLHLTSQEKSLSSVVSK